jgi:endoglycosylceramidase
MRAVLLCLTLAACGGSPRPTFAPLDSDGTHFRDADGRAVILRGVNARATPMFDQVLDGGRAPLEPLQPLLDEDVARMHELGFNLLRLPLNWSGIEPEPGAYAQAYLDATAEAVELCRRHDVLVLLDIHQDAWSKEIGEDGAPLWAILPAPAMLLGGPLTDLDKRRTSDPVMRAFASFFTTNTDGLQEKFAAMMQQLAMRFREDQAVLGYEIFNEPVATEAELLTFHTKVAQAIRQVDPRHLIAFEPAVTRNFTNATVPADAPFPVGGAVYAPHIYTAVFGDDARLANDTYANVLHGSWLAAREEADAWNTPLLVGELGIGPEQPNANSWIGRAFDAADEVLASTAWWVWKESAMGRWGFFDQQPDGSWTDRPAFIAAVARPYARAIGGDPTGMRWDGTQLTVTFKGKNGVHDLFFPFPVTTASCNGAGVAVAGTQPFYTVRCADGELTVSR